MSKHKGKVHPVGSYKGHLTKSRRVWNNLRLGVDYGTGQMTGDIAYRMTRPQAMNQQEVAAAKDAGLSIKGQFCVSNLDR